MANNENPPTSASEREAIADVDVQAEEIIEIAKRQAVASEEAGDADVQDFGDANVADSFRGLPMRELIAGPLLAAAEAQQKLASVAWDYFQKIGFETDQNGKPTGKTRTLDFTLNRPIEQNGELQVMEQRVQAPFIGLVPIPSLLIDRVDVDFQMEVTATNTTTEKSEASAESKISAKWWVVSAEVSGKVSSSRENTRSTNQTAKYQVHVSASQQQQTEGLSKLMDIMASCIEPMRATSK